MHHRTKYNTEPQPKTQGYMGGLLHTERNTHSEHPLVTNWVTLSLFHTAGSVYRHSSSFSSLKFIQCAGKLQADLLVCSVASGRLFIARRMRLCCIQFFKCFTPVWLKNHQFLNVIRWKWLLKLNTEIIWKLLMCEDDFWIMNSSNTSKHCVCILNYRFIHFYICIKW